MALTGPISQAWIRGRGAIQQVFYEFNENNGNLQNLTVQGGFTGSLTAIAFEDGVEVDRFEFGPGAGSANLRPLGWQLTFTTDPGSTESWWELPTNQVFEFRRV